MSVEGSLTGSPSSIYVGNGLYMDVLDPKREHVTPELLARGLSNVCRFAGRTPKFYSVAQHCCLCIELFRMFRDYLTSRYVDQLDVLGNDAELCILLHDASEAFIGDIPRPLKAGPSPIISEAYLRAEEALMRTVGKAYMISDTEWWRNPVVKLVDGIALFTERRILFPETERQRWEGQEAFRDYPVDLRRLSHTVLEPEFAYRKWMEEYGRIKRERLQSLFW